MRPPLKINTDARYPVIRNPLWVVVCLASFLIIWAASFFFTTDYENWMLENILVITFLVSMIFAWRNHPLSNLSYFLITLFLCLHVYGATYAYAQNPFGEWLQRIFSMQRNNFDRIVHFAFGLLFAFPLREVFSKWIKTREWVIWLFPIHITLALSVTFELLEWGVAEVFTLHAGDAYLGMQGDIFDAQKDIFMAFLGALTGTSVISLIYVLLSGKNQK